MGPKEEAIKILEAFDSACYAAAFSQITQATLVEGLRVRILDPLKIDQGGANLCGPAAFLYDLASRDPVAYAKFVIALYKDGEAKIGKFAIKPSKDLKSYKLPITGNPPHPADWIPMASIRNSKGSIIFWDKYDNVSDEASGITTPGNLRKWLRDVGYGEVIDRAAEFGLSVGEAKKRLQEALDKNNNGYRVFLLIKAEVLGGMDDSKQAKKEGKGKKAKSAGTFPNHWVVLESGIMATTTAKLWVYSWGGQMSIPPAGENWTLDHIAARYYGYIAGKY